MGYSLENEIRGAIFCDPEFSENFLSIDEEHQPLLDEHLTRLPTNIHLLDDSITAERRLYAPILDVLRPIKQAVDTVRAAIHLGVLGTTFRDSHNTVIQGDGPETHLIKPDLILFEDDDPTRCHWESVMLPVEVKAKRNYLKVGMKQLTRYACATFAHQIHRRHLYGMVVCKWAATFVRFDRSGIVHSEPIDMLRNYEKFRQAFAGLMMLDRRAFGCDTAFTTELTPEGRLEYYVDLPAAALPQGPDNTGLEGGTPANPALKVSPIAGPAHRLPTFRQYPVRKFKVMERLCHRKSIRGRATIVLRIREVQKHTHQPEFRRGSLDATGSIYTKSQISQLEWEEVPGRCDYALKLAWQDPSKSQEGAILKHLEGEYGVVPCQWYADILQWDANCHESGAKSCEICCDMTPARAGVGKLKNLGDLDVEVDQEEDGKEPRYVEVDTVGYIGGSHTYPMPRIYTWTLFSVVGRSLSTAETPRHFLEAVLDAILGYWQTFNRGILHQDISDGNVLLSTPGQSYDIYKWGLKHASAVKEEEKQSTQENDPVMESKRLAQETIIRLGRDPVGFLCDFDLAKIHDRAKSESHEQAWKEDRACGSRKRAADKGVNGEPAAKRLRWDEDYLGIFSSTISRNAQEEEDEQIDFRTGTPTFMSIRVLEVGVGKRYEHHFMDDLESFFWLILWCTVQHIDPRPDGNERNGPTETALTILHYLDRADSDFRTLAHSKRALLTQCSDGSEDEPPSIVDILEECKNSWANNATIVSVIVELGSYFNRLYSRRNRYSRCTPAAEFPKLVLIISSALESS
ncbi:hypothetical protein OPQ81_000740 [Rhizoctonia solani]|nr:hypothetical protein OPQ81_000740 [Rhizoctonia solani]